MWWCDSDKSSAGAKTWSVGPVRTSSLTTGGKVSRSRSESDGAIRPLASSGSEGGKGQNFLFGDNHHHSAGATSMSQRPGTVGNINSGGINGGNINNTSTRVPSGGGGGNNTSNYRRPATAPQATVTGTTGIDAFQGSTLRIEAGRPRIERCDVGSDAASCIYVKDASPAIVGNFVSYAPVFVKVIFRCGEIFYIEN